MKCPSHPAQKTFIRKIVTEAIIDSRGLLTTGDITITTSIICPRCDDLISIEKTTKNSRK